MKKILLLCGLFALGDACATDVETQSVDLVSGLYVGAGMSFARASDKTSVIWNNMGHPCVEMQSRKVNIIGCGLAVGYGKCVSDRLYIGGELSLDVSGNKSYEGQYDFDGIVKYSGKNYGVVPSIVVRIGCCYGSSTMIYLRGGVARVKSSFSDGIAQVVVDYIKNRGRDAEGYGSSINMSKVVPVLGIGIEKRINDKFGVRLEGDYRFNAQKASVEGVHAANINPEIGIRNRIQGFSVRLMGTYTFKM